MTSVSDALAKDILHANTTVENLQLKLQLTVVQHQQLTAEGQKAAAARDVLIEQARSEVNAPKDHVYNTETQQFQPRSGPVPLSTNRTRQAKRAKKGQAA